MTRRPRRNHTRLSRQKWHLPLSGASRRLWNCPSSSTCTPTKSSNGKTSFLRGATGVFGDEAKTEPTHPTVDVKTLHAKIGELTLENDFLAGALGKAGLLGGKK